MEPRKTEIWKTIGKLERKWIDHITEKKTDNRWTTSMKSHKDQSSIKKKKTRWFDDLDEFQP